MTGDAVGPALSAEEWAAYSFVGEGILGLPVHAIDLSRHGIAALCLDGEPFGFTREELAALEWVSSGTARPDLLPLREDGVIIDIGAVDVTLQRLAAKISALLPPEGT